MVSINSADFSFTPKHFKQFPLVQKPVVYVSYCDDGAIVCDPQNDALLKLNSTAIEIWTLLSGGHTHRQIIKNMAQKYEVDQSVVEKDVLTLLSRLAGHNLSVDSTLLTCTENSQASSSQFTFPWYAQTAQRALRPRLRLVLKALVALATFDAVLSFTNFQNLLEKVQKWPIQPHVPDEAKDVPEICAAVEQACVWYPKRALCLQRSAITTVLLRDRGIPAKMVIAVRAMPLFAHAWVEVRGAVINDFPRVQQFYTRLSSF